LLVILSEARRSVATERKSKDPCTLTLERWHQGILTVHSVIKLFPVCKCQGTCCRVPHSFVILSDAKKRSDRAGESKDAMPCRNRPPPAPPWKSGALAPRSPPHQRGALAPEMKKPRITPRLVTPFVCHPERRARKRSDRAQVEGPLHSHLGTLASGNSHRAPCDQTFSRVQLPGNLLPRTLFACHPELAIAAAYPCCLSS
jgi:hypothetical protein